MLTDGESSLTAFWAAEASRSTCANRSSACWVFSTQGITVPSR